MKTRLTKMDPMSHQPSQTPNNSTDPSPLSLGCIGPESTPLSITVNPTVHSAAQPIPNHVDHQPASPDFSDQIVPNSMVSDVMPAHPHSAQPSSNILSDQIVQNAMLSTQIFPHILDPLKHQGWHPIAVGTDITDIRRIHGLLQRRPEFLKKILTPWEQEYVQSRHDLAASVAKRFAAKEACAKAMGTGIGQWVGWQDMEIQSTPLGQPHIHLSNQAWTRLEQRWPCRPHMALSLADEYPYALAFVVMAWAPHSWDHINTQPIY